MALPALRPSSPGAPVFAEQLLQRRCDDMPPAPCLAGPSSPLASLRLRLPAREGFAGSAARRRAWQLLQQGSGSPARRADGICVARRDCSPTADSLRAESPAGATGSGSRSSTHLHSHTGEGSVQSCSPVPRRPSGGPSAPPAPPPAAASSVSLSLRAAPAPALASAGRRALLCSAALLAAAGAPPEGLRAAREGRPASAAAHAAEAPAPPAGAAAAPAAAPPAFALLEGGVRVLDVSVHYVGRLAAKQGWRFDSTYDHLDGAGNPVPFDFELGAPEVIRGLSVAVAGMRVGGIRRAVIPPALSYQSTSDEPLPPNFSSRQRLFTTVFNPTRLANGEGSFLATVVFDIELLAVRAAQ